MARALQKGASIHGARCQSPRARIAYGMRLTAERVSRMAAPRRTAPDCARRHRTAPRARLHHTGLCYTGPHAAPDRARTGLHHTGSHLACFCVSRARA